MMNLRGVANIETVQRERDVLRCLLNQGHPFVIWDAELKRVWTSPEAQALLQNTALASELERALASAAERLRARADGAPNPAALPPTPLQTKVDCPVLAKITTVSTLDGYLWFAAELVRHPIAQSKLATLTHSEMVVLDLLTSDLSNREIAARLSVSVETVRTHVRRILSKLDVTSRAKAISVVSEIRSNARVRDRDHLRTQRGLESSFETAPASGTRRENGS